jgi:PKD repeat protein
MKATLFFFLLSALCFGQQAPSVNIWGVRPDSICPGDTIIVTYKLGTIPSPTNAATVSFYMAPYTIWTGPWVTLKSQPKEIHTNGVDSVYVYKIASPTVPTPTPGMYYVTGSSAATGTFNQIYLKDCSCTLTAGFTYTANNLEVAFTSTTAGATSTTSYLWDFGQGWQSGGASNTYTFFTPGTYTIGLSAENKFCTDNVFTTITVSAAPTNTLDVGMHEYQLDNSAPVYFDFTGNKVNPSPGVILIEQRGTIRKKVVFSTK